MTQSVEFDSSIYHYPTALLNKLTDAIPCLCKSKRDVITLFRSAGVEKSILTGWATKLRADRDAVKKHAIAHDVLCCINEKRGNEGLRQRREVVKRVVEFEDFSACWERDRYKAQALVAEIREIVNVKDSFTRMKQERDREREERIAARDAEAGKQEATRKEREQIRSDFYALFHEGDHRKRGLVLEAVINRLFESFGILVRESFRLRGTEGEGIVEQIDGVIVLDGHIYLVEVKWWEKTIGTADIAQHFVRVMSRHGARGIFISASDYTEPVITQAKDFLQHRVSVLCELQEFVLLLEHDHDLKEVLRHKVQAAILDKKPFARCNL